MQEASGINQSNEIAQEFVLSWHPSSYWKCQDYVSLYNMRVLKYYIANKALFETWN